MQPSLLPTSALARMERLLPAIYLVLALTLTTLLSLLTPPFFAPDEPHHAARAIALAHGHFLISPGPAEPGAPIDRNALRVMDAFDDLREAAERRADSRPSSNFRNRPWGPLAATQPLPLSTLRWSHQTAFAPFPNTAVYPPFLYLPSIIGWRIAEAANLTILQGLHLARLLSALLAIALGWIALRLCTGFRSQLLLFLLLPSVLFLNASSSQDAVLLSIAALAAALLSRPLAANRAFTLPELAAEALLLTLCATARPPYLGLALLLFLPTANLTPQPRRNWLAPATAFVAVLVLAGIWRHLVTPLGLDTADAADPTAQWLFLRSHPLAGLATLLKATATAAVDLLHRGLYVVGWDDLVAPRWLILPLAAASAVLLLFAPRLPLSNARARALLALAVLSPLLGISLAEYIIWTPSGSPTVYGIQPRYWLPILPLIAMLLQSVLPQRPRTASTWPLLTSAAAIILIAATLPSIAAHAFYLSTIAHALQLNLR